MVKLTATGKSGEKTKTWDKEVEPGLAEKMLRKSPNWKLHKDEKAYVFKDGALVKKATGKPDDK